MQKLVETQQISLETILITHKKSLGLTQALILKSLHTDFAARFYRSHYIFSRDKVCW